MTVWLLVTYFAGQPIPELGSGVGGLPMNKATCQSAAAFAPPKGMGHICVSMPWPAAWGPAPPMAEKD